VTALKTLIATAALATAMIAGSAAQATTTILLQDNFESYSPSKHGATFYDLNFTGFTSGLHAQGGTVDLIGTPNAWSLFGASNYIDLDGSTRDGATLRTDTFTFAAGDVVTLSFQLAGSQRRGHGSEQWNFGFQTTGGNISFLNIQQVGPLQVGAGSSAVGSGISAGDTALAYNSPWTAYSLSFLAGSAGSFTAFIGTTSHDNIGPLVDDILLTRDTTVVPEPATWLMMIMGFGGMGAVLRRRTAVAFA
jgi:hypothetical protein